MFSFGEITQHSFNQGLKLVFNVCRTPSADIESTILYSINRSANNCNVQSERPSGAGEQALAIKNVHEVSCNSYSITAHFVKLTDPFFSA